VGGEHTRPLQELRRDDAARFGGKSASLGELIGAEVPVPPGFAVSAGAFRAFMEAAELDGRVERELAGLDPEDVDALNAAAAAIGEAISAQPVPEALRAEIEAGYAALAASAGQDGPPVAVRSSALGEDSPEATFAGQQETYLWVRGAAAVGDAVRDCWASLYGPQAISYRARMGSAAAPAMGVAVQAMIDAAVSGVMFTCNPVSGDPSTVAVNASWGLGLAVVGGEVTPDEYRVSKVTREVLHRTVGDKAVEYRPDPAGGTVRAEVPRERREVPCLDDDQLSELVDLGRRVERHFGSHQDVEWAIDPGGALHLLQSRPVTTGVAQRARPTPRRSAMAHVMGTFGVAPDAGDDS
jgi:pyruvate,water dikinase